jgi:hypothetical protein
MKMYKKRNKRNTSRERKEKKLIVTETMNIVVFQKKAIRKINYEAI